MNHREQPWQAGQATQSCSEPLKGLFCHFGSGGMSPDVGITNDYCLLYGHPGRDPSADIYEHGHGGARPTGRPLAWS